MLLEIHVMQQKMLISFGLLLLKCIQVTQSHDSIDNMINFTVMV